MQSRAMASLTPMYHPSDESVRAPMTPLDLFYIFFTFEGSIRKSTYNIFPLTELTFISISR